MFQVSLGSNSGEDHPGTHPTVNPWLDAMEVDSIPCYPTSTTNTNTSTLNPPVQMEADDQHPQYHPQDDSANNPDSVNSTAAKNPAEEWVKSKVQLQEVDYSQCLREELQQTKVSLTQVSRQNEELAQQEREIVDVKLQYQAQHQKYTELLEQEKERIRVQKENELAIMAKQHEHNLRELQKKMQSLPARHTMPATSDINFRPALSHFHEESQSPSGSPTPRHSQQLPASYQDFSWEEPQVPHSWSHTPYQAFSPEESRVPQKPPSSHRGSQVCTQVKKSKSHVSKRVRIIGNLTDDRNDTEDADDRSNDNEKGTPESHSGSEDMMWKCMESMLNRLLDEHGIKDGALSSNTIPRRGKQRKKDNDLEKERDHEHHSEHLAYVWNLFQQVYNVEKDEDFRSFPSATAEQGAPTSPWNEVVLGILTDRLIMELENKRPSPFPKKTRGREWSRAQPHRTDTGRIEDANEIEEHRIMYTDKRLKRIRVREWRVRKYERRLIIAQGVAEMKEEAEENDANIWRWLADILEQLGADGMSSDESGIEDEIEIIYNTKAMPWRKDLKTELQIIDDQRLVDTDIFTPRGSKPVK
ncbi:hypothetical protein SCLCIDRAFT_25568 [Scleroderma citrinum Foug A]|uniref:Uncharacterized protein n=1 Tax=Scleroderma citrinum Foug A TaxID=1036808 RepID=A0A0C2ZJJ2_9AGAM|nr:hypothetical protein SCLCIDRAFT_25568 [Scleroderma citrinum Foug A]